MESSSFERMRMKMASVPAITFFLLCCSLITSTDSAGVCNIYGGRGQKVSLPLGKSDISVDYLKWSRDGTIIFRQRNKDIIHGKKEDIDSTGSLILENLAKDKEGVYKAEVFSKDGTQIHISKAIRLCVLEPVKVPAMKMECVKPDHVQFTCIPDKSDKNPNITWLKNKQLEKSSELTWKLKAKEVEKDEISCKVSNQVSDQFSKPQVQTCFKHPAIELPDELFGIGIWYVIGGGGGLVLLLIIIVIFCCIRTKRKKRMRLNDAEELRLNFGTGDEQRCPDQHPPTAHNHHHPPPNTHQRHHPQQQAAGHTGPRQNRSRNLRPKAPDPPEAHPNPAPRQAGRGPLPANPVNDEQPPPLPQPRKKVPKGHRA